MFRHYQTEFYNVPYNTTNTASLFTIEATWTYLSGALFIYSKRKEVLETCNLLLGLSFSLVYKVIVLISMLINSSLHKVTQNSVQKTFLSFPRGLPYPFQVHWLVVNYTITCLTLSGLFYHEDTIGHLFIHTFVANSM